MLLQTLNNSVRGRAKVSSTSLISDQSSLDLNSCRYLQEENTEDLAMSFSSFAPKVNTVELKSNSLKGWRKPVAQNNSKCCGKAKVSVASWIGSEQFEGLRLWCGNRRFGSGSPSQSTGWAIFEGNLLFLWYWWHHLACGNTKTNWLEQLLQVFTARPELPRQVSTYLFLDLFWAAQHQIDNIFFDCCSVGLRYSVWLIFNLQMTNHRL